MTGSPGQTCPQRRQWFVQRERGHGHQMISAADDVNGTCCKTGQDADQQSTALKKSFCRTSWITLNQLGQSRLNVLLTHQRLSDQHGIGTSGLHAVQVRPFEQA